MGTRLIFSDTRQHAGKHEIKEKWWADHGVAVHRAKLDFGDYMAEGSNVSVDTKRNVDEIAQNIGGKSHGRFRRECERAAAAGYRLVVLVENGEGIADVSDLLCWTNGHCRACSFAHARKCRPHDPRGKCAKHGTMKPIQGDRLARAMSTMAARYGVCFRFCAPEESARTVCELLGVDYDE